VTQAGALAAGFLFIGLYHGLLTGTEALLFGSFLGVTDAQLTALAIILVVAGVGVMSIGRPLLFATIDPDVAAAAGVPVRALAFAFIVVVGITVAAAAQITGVLLVFALLVLPAAAAHAVTARPAFGIALSVGLALTITWAGLFVAYYSPYPLGFWLTTFAFSAYAGAAAYRALRLRQRAHHTAARASASSPSSP
jgi:zinc/manganese transport system permease protein